MQPAERRMLNYLFLASQADQKQQSIGRDRFLVLAIPAAASAGWISVAECCKRLIAGSSPRHLIHNTPTAAEALKTSEFTLLLRQLERGCPAERAEQLAENLGFQAEAVWAAHHENADHFWQSLFENAEPQHSPNSEL